MLISCKTDRFTLFSMYVFRSCEFLSVLIVLNGLKHTVESRSNNCQTIQNVQQSISDKN